MAGLLDLNALGGSIDANIKRTEKKQQFERGATERKLELSTAAARESAATTTASMESAAKTREQQLAMYGSMEETLQVAQEAMQLSDSNNPLDRLQLWLMQQSDDRYTSEGNTKRLQYLQSAAGALASREIINQEAFQDELTTIQNDLALELMDDENKLAMLNMSIAQGQELINAHVEGQAVLAGAMSTQAQMQETALAGMTLEQLQVATEKADAKGQRSITIGGIEIAKGRLDERIAALQQRQYTVTVQQATMVDQALANLTDEQLQLKLSEAQNSKDGFAQIGNVRVSTNRILDNQQIRRSNDLTLQGQEMGVQNSIRAITMRNHEEYAKSLNVSELNDLIIAGGKSEEMGGAMLDLNMLQTIRDQKAGAEAQKQQTEFALATAGNPMESVVQHSNWLDQLESSVSATSPNSPLLAAIAKSKQIAAVAGKFVGEAADQGEAGLTRMLEGLRAIPADRANIEGLLNQEAERLSMGDKPKELALQYQLRGHQIPEEVIVDGLAERVRKKRPVSDWLPPAAAGVFQNAYQQAMSDLRNLPSNLASRPSDSDLQAQAMSIALEATTQHLAGGWTEQIMAAAVASGSQFNMPLNGVVTPERFMALVRRADQNGANRYQETTGATPEQMATWMSGQEANLDLATEQAAQLVIELEQIKPGLGKAYAEWWGGEDAQGFITMFGTSKQQTANSEGFQSSVATALVLPGLQGDMQAYGQMLQQGMASQVTKQLAADYTNFVTFGGNPVNMQVFLLEQDSTLTGVQKQTIMQRLVLPVIQEAQALGASPQETNVMIEQKLRTSTFQDPEMKRLQTLLLKNRDGSIKTLNDFINGQNISQFHVMSQNPFAGLMQGFQNELFGNPMDRQITGYEWWREMGQQ